MPKTNTIAVALLSTIFVGATPAHSPLAVSEWVYVGADGHLQYKTDANGNRVLDFSYAGYEGGGVTLPTVPVASTLSPVSGDNTSAIQAALDAAAKLLPDASGFRGAVLLAAGTYPVTGTLSITASGVVLRGSGSSSTGTVLDMTSGPPRLLLSIEGTGSYDKAGTSTSITDAYVPSGATTLHVSSAAGLAVGDAVLVGRPVTQAWVDFMGMNTLTGTTGAQTWIPVGTVIDTDRTIAAIAGDAITLDVPVADSFDATYLSPPGGTVAAYTFPGRLTQVGVEHLQVVGAAVNAAITAPQYNGAELDAVEDAWLDDLVLQDTQNTIVVGNAAKRVTLEQVHVTHTVAHTGDRMADFGLSGTQILLDSCSSDGTGEWPLVTQGEVSGPIVALDFESTQEAGIGPHQRWAVGLLTDNATLPNAPNDSDGGATGISYSDRGNHGSGQGWAMGWGVAWNVTTPYIVVQQPPGAQSWCIGCIGMEVSAVESGSGKAVPNGIYDSLGTHVTPRSLYLAQLCDRLGPAALVNIGYTGADCAVPMTTADGGVTMEDGGVAVEAGTGTEAGTGPGTSDDAGGGTSKPPGNDAGAQPNADTSGGSSGCGCAVPGGTTDGAGLGAMAAVAGIAMGTRRRRHVEPRLPGPMTRKRGGPQG